MFATMVGNATGNEVVAAMWE